MTGDHATTATTTSAVTVVPAGLGPVPLQVTVRGEGAPILLLHGGAGPVSVNGFADRLAGERPARVHTPSHPGFDGTERPEHLTSIRQLAGVYADLLDHLDLSDVTVIGNSIGGWIAAELALLHSTRVGRLVIIDAVGIDVPEHPIVDFFSLTLPEIADYSYADPDRYRINPDELSPEARQAMAGNRAALAVYGGTPSMVDPTLRDRLSGIDRPTLVVWGDADRIAHPAIGTAYAEAIPEAQLVVMERTGHLPQIESPDRLLSVLNVFLAATQNSPA